MRMMDLFSGIGGFHLAAEWVWGKQLEVVAHCEIEPYPQKVLLKHWPNVPIISDIHKLKGDHLGTIDLITGGFPCQPYSVAGKRRGAKDDRALWPEMLRVIQESKPRWVVAENVGGFVNMGLDNCIADLEAQGYEVQPVIIPACAVGAWHRRDRVWIVANAKRYRSQWIWTERIIAGSSGLCGGAWGDKDKGIQSGKNFWEVEPDVGRVVARLSSRVDRLKGLGNAIVPQVAAVIMQAIKWIDENE